MGFDPATGRYSVWLGWNMLVLRHLPKPHNLRKVVILSDKSVGLQAEGATLLLLKEDLHHVAFGVHVAGSGRSDGVHELRQYFLVVMICKPARS